MSNKLILYNEKYVPQGIGIANHGNSCYFNSLMQCILSCPSIYQALNENKFNTEYISNTLVNKLLELFEIALKRGNIDQICLDLWNIIITISQKRKDTHHMYIGQQNDAHEGLMMIMDVLDYIPHMKVLFEHRHNTQIICFNCKKLIVNKNEENTIFEIQPTLTTEQVEEYKEIDCNYGKTLDLNTFLKINNSYVDDFKCPNCSDTNKKFKSTRLAMIPEILPILIKKYDKKIQTEFPEYLEFKNLPCNKKYIYRLVSQSEHSGGRNGGHYWAISLRNESGLKYKLLNDSSVSDCNYQPTINTYMIFYHVYKVMEIDARYN